MKELRIRAIMFDRVKINDDWYQKGDRIGLAVITDININEISLKYDILEVKIKIQDNDKINID